jgi:hypothetical protein
MKLFQRDAVSLEARHSLATHETETHGNYHIGEIAYITTVSDVPYVSSVGLCARRDEMPRKARHDRDREQATRELERKAVKDSVRAKQSTKDDESVVDVEATTV